jgi:hypothetical protein
MAGGYKSSETCQVPSVQYAQHLQESKEVQRELRETRLSLDAFYLWNQLYILKATRSTDLGAWRNKDGRSQGDILNTAGFRAARDRRRKRGRSCRGPDVASG